MWLSQPYLTGFLGFFTARATDTSFSTVARVTLMVARVTLMVARVTLMVASVTLVVARVTLMVARVTLVVARVTLMVARVTLRVTLVVARVTLMVAPIVCTFNNSQTLAKKRGLIQLSFYIYLHICCSTAGRTREERV